MWADKYLVEGIWDVRVDLFPMVELTVADVTERVIDQRRRAINQEK